MPPIYLSSEDSYILSKIIEEQIPSLLKKNKNIIFLEIGSGSGIQLQTVLKSGVKKQSIFSCDINPKAVGLCKQLGFNCVKSDLFENINTMRISLGASKEVAAQRLEKSQRKPTDCFQFDIIAFNPPYLPEDKREPVSSGIATTGGKTGSEIINRFLKQAKNYLTREGKIFLLVSSLTKGINWDGWNRRLLGEKDLFFEKLKVWELSH